MQIFPSPKKLYYVRTQCKKVLKVLNDIKMIRNESWLGTPLITKDQFCINTCNTWKIYCSETLIHIPHQETCRALGHTVFWYNSRALSSWFTFVLFISFFIFGFWSLLATKLRKYYVIFVYILQGKMEKMERKSRN